MLSCLKQINAQGTRETLLPPAVSAADTAKPPETSTSATIRRNRFYLTFLIQDKSMKDFIITALATTTVAMDAMKLPTGVSNILNSLKKFRL